MDQPARNFCSVCSKVAGIDPGGTAWATSRFLIPELPLPWPNDPLEARAIQPGVPETLLKLWNDAVDVGIFAVAPDPTYSIPGKTRILAFDFAASPGGPADRLDYLAPAELVAPTIDALARNLPVPAQVEIDDTPYRDVMICTHGSRDACCATFGFPLYRTLRAASESSPDLRVWRATHFGGHRFAPTMATYPDGRTWGYLEAETGQAIITRQGSTASLGAHYRGWSGYDDGGLQLLEREAFIRIGWSWLDYRQQGRILTDNADSLGSRQLAIDAVSPEGDHITITGTVVPSEAISAMASCGDEDYRTEQYAVTKVTICHSEHLAEPVLHS